MEIASWKWEYVAPTDEWQLSVTTPLLNKTSTVEANRRRDDALRKANIKPSLRRRIILKPAKRPKGG